MRPTDQLTISEVSRRSGFAPSALRYYEAEGLIAAERTSGNQRRYQRQVLRRLAFVRAASVVGLTLDEVRAELASLPSGRNPSKADWARISRHWRGRSRSRSPRWSGCSDGLDSCIGCGCLSLRAARSRTPRTPSDATGRAGPPAACAAGRTRRGGRRSEWSRDWASAVLDQRDSYSKDFLSASRVAVRSRRASRFRTGVTML